MMAVAVAVSVRQSGSQAVLACLVLGKMTKSDTVPGFKKIRPLHFYLYKKDTVDTVATVHTVDTMLLVASTSSSCSTNYASTQWLGLRSL